MYRCAEVRTGEMSDHRREAAELHVRILEEKLVEKEKKNSSNEALAGWGILMFGNPTFRISQISEITFTKLSKPDQSRGPQRRSVKFPRSSNLINSKC